MNSRTLGGLLTPIPRVVLALLAAATLQADTAVTFQNGANGYSGASDISINTQYAQYNGGNGVRWTGDPELGCYSTTGSGAYTERYLLKFGSITVPAGSIVTSATLTMSLDSWNSGSGNITGFYLKNSWNVGSTRMGWIHRDDTSDWAGGGASGAGVDTVAGKSFQVPPLRPVGAQSVTILLDPSLVQSWINSPATNQGIMLVNNNPGEIIRPVSTAGTQAMRPKLTIVLAGTSGVQVTITPPSASLQPGGKQTFAATVTGSSNTAVTWTATGGTITTAGAYTAGSTPGSFTATATSAADPSKSATATVTVSVQPLSITLSPTSVTLQAGQTQQFTATVTGTTNTSVTWMATGGTINSTGLFTAGSTAGSFTVTATSLADTTKNAKAAVTIQSAPPPVSVTISPTTATVQAGKTQQFTATVTGSSNTAVKWTSTGGTVSTTGLFTAGSTAGTNFAVTATSMADTTKSAKAKVTVQAVPPVQVTVSPVSVILQPGGVQQFTATVTGAANSAVTWTATGGAITSSGQYTAGQTLGTYTVTATSVQDATKSGVAGVTVFTQTTGDRPRIILDSGTLATMRSRAAANTAQWKAMKSTCDSMVGGTVNFPGDNGYPDLPNVGEGYQGSSYLDAIMPLGLCYQILKSSDPATAVKYGTKGVAILTAMSDPAHQTIGSTPIQDRDDGYGIRFYGVTMGIGYDWFHDLLTPALETQLQNALNTWIHGFENDSPDAFEYEHPMGNYYAGYYAAKCMAALAVQGDSPLGDTWWNDWYNHQHNQFMAPYFAVNLAGGGWPEGFANYGPLSIRNMSLPALAVRAAKGIDLIHAPQQPFPFPLDTARWVMHFTWPSRDMIDDRDTVHSNSSDTIWPGTPDSGTYSFLAGYLAMWNDPLAPAMHKYARDAKAALTHEGAGDVDTWIEFLFWDDSAPEADYAPLGLSYVAPGTGEVSARSDWTNNASWMSFRSGPYVNNPGAGHQGFDAGSLALVRDKSPLLVNVEGWLAHNPNGDPGENAIYDDNFGNWDADHTLGNRRLYNTFQVRHLGSGGTILDNFGQWAMQRSDGAKTQISRYEDGGSYVLALGQYLEDMYRPFQTICGAKPVSSWSREVVYLRPSQFVVYDRTSICDSSLDHYMAFHFPAPPTEVTPPATGEHRFDVTFGTFAGSMTTILPPNPTFATTDQVAPDSSTWNRVWRTEIRASGAQGVTQQWLTVFDLSGSPAQVAAATPIAVTNGAIVGAVLALPAGNNVTVFGTAPAGTPIAGTITYTLPAAQTRHVITDLTPQAAYTVSVSVSGSTHTVTITPGGTLRATANGVLSFGLSSAGVLQP